MESESYSLGVRSIIVAIVMVVAAGWHLYRSSGQIPFFEFAVVFVAGAWFAAALILMGKGDRLLAIRNRGERKKQVDRRNLRR